MLKARRITGESCSVIDLFQLLAQAFPSLSLVDPVILPEFCKVGAENCLEFCKSLVHSSVNEMNTFLSKNLEAISEGPGSEMALAEVVAVFTEAVLKNKEQPFKYEVTLSRASCIRMNDVTGVCARFATYMDEIFALLPKLDFETEEDSATVTDELYQVEAQYKKQLRRRCKTAPRELVAAINPFIEALILALVKSSGPDTPSDSVPAEAKVVHSLEPPESTPETVLLKEMMHLSRLLGIDVDLLADVLQALDNDVRAVVTYLREKQQEFELTAEQEATAQVSTLKELIAIAHRMNIEHGQLADMIAAFDNDLDKTWHYLNKEMSTKKSRRYDFPPHCPSSTSTKFIIKYQGTWSLCNLMSDV